MTGYPSDYTCGPFKTAGVGDIDLISNADNIIALTFKNQKFMSKSKTLALWFSGIGAVGVLQPKLMQDLLCASADATYNQFVQLLIGRGAPISADRMFAE
jgi:hypothetical protein